jgi:hypothetical protein
VRSVYDTDGLGRMGDAVLTAADLAPAAPKAIAKTTPGRGPTRARRWPTCAPEGPGRPGLPLRPGALPARDPRGGAAGQQHGHAPAIGETDFEQQQILGYAPIEPDGSVKLQVPADTPLALAGGRRRGPRPSRRTPTGSRCAPANAAPATAATARAAARAELGRRVNHPARGLAPGAGRRTQGGETMASLRTRLDPALLTLAADPVSPTPGPTPRSPACRRARHQRCATPATRAADDLATAVPRHGVINYPDTSSRCGRATAAGGSCLHRCHAERQAAGPARHDRRQRPPGQYEELLIGDPLLDASGRR